ncbi:MAG: TIGR02266 family protein [Archangium sp.]
MKTVELNRREMELQVTESALHLEAERLAARASELKARQPKGLRPVTVQTEAIRELELRSEKARREALEAREAVNARLRSMLDTTASALKKLEEELEGRKEDVKPAAPPGLRAVSKKNSPKDLGLAAHLLDAMENREVAEIDEPLSSAPTASLRVLAPPPPVETISPIPSPAPTPVVRVSPRVKMNAQVDFGSESNFYTGFSSNISEGGLFVTTVKLLPLGTEVELGFSLPSGERIDTRAVVRWLRESNEVMPEMLDGMGLQFIDLPPEARTAIEQFVEQRDPLFFAA